MREHQYPQYLIDKAYKSAYRNLISNNNVLLENNDDQFKNILILPYNKKICCTYQLFLKGILMYVYFSKIQTQLKTN